MAMGRAGFRDRLLTAYRSLSADEFALAVVQWRKDLALELKTNRGCYMQSGRPALSQALEKEITLSCFPDLSLLEIYISPHGEVRNLQYQPVGTLSPVALSKWFELELRTGHCEKIIKMCDAGVWEAMVIQRMCRIPFGTVLSQNMCSVQLIRVDRIKRPPGSPHMYRLEVNVEGLINLISENLHGLHSLPLSKSRTAPKPLPRDQDNRWIWIPVDIVHRTVPALEAAYLSRKWGVGVKLGTVSMQSNNCQWLLV
jgi:hypothetical protein